MRNKKKVCVVVTARPSYSRIRSALFELTKMEGVELQLVVAASALLDRYGKAVEVIIKDGFNIDAEVYNILEGDNPTIMAKTTGLGILELSTVFDDLRPDVVVSVADRFETISTAICASYMNIPLVHIQGGEVTGSIDEKVRHSVTKMADLHLVSSEQAAERVIKMGESQSSVIVTGCPSIDIAREVKECGGVVFDPYDKYNGVGAKPDLSDGYVVVMLHPVTTEHEKSHSQARCTIEAVNSLDLPVCWFWPNVDAGSDGISKAIRQFREKQETEKIHFFKNMVPEDFLSFLMRSKCIIGNSSVGVRECAYLGVPSVNIGVRQNGRDKGENVIDVEFDSSSIVKAVNFHLEHGPYCSDSIYGDGHAGKKIASSIACWKPTISKVLQY